MNRAPLIESDQIQRLSRPVVLDVRWYLDGRDGLTSYLDGHYPGAIFVDLDTVATQPDDDATAGRHPLPSPARFAHSLASLGIDSTSQVLVMDDARGSIAARIWWMLDALDIEAYVLSGGVQCFRPTDLCTSPCLPVPIAPWVPTRRDWPADRIITTEAIEATNFEYLLLDARAQNRYLGVEEPIDRVGGHIPGAKSLPWQTLLDLIETDPDATENPEIRALLADDRAVAAYCGSGVTACALVLAFRVLGRDIKLYPASYSGWSSNVSHPICTQPC
ncbi:rhodanese-like domain-containing protein [Ferrimicrobium sp.]|uniref:sulfurtransferase n=1 Tax=Ferrimicrobium sp. TaxID=2926050 RepID=UPI0026127A28|nr:rhodanese-like domain-containing protein [Ferrimicrobium sp.]